MLKTYSPRITILKGLEIFIMGGIGALLAHLAGLDPTSTIIGTIIIIKAIENYLKNNTNFFR